MSSPAAACQQAELNRRQLQHTVQHLLLAMATCTPRAQSPLTVGLVADQKRTQRVVSQKNVTGVAAVTQSYGCM